MTYSVNYLCCRRSRKGKCGRRLDFCHHAVAAHGGAVVAEEAGDKVRIPFASTHET